MAPMKTSSCGYSVSSLRRPARTSSSIPLPEGLRSYLGVPHEMDENDGRILGGYIRYMLDVQQVPYEMVRWTKDETWIKVKSGFHRTL